MLPIPCCVVLDKLVIWLWVYDTKKRGLDYSNSFKWCSQTFRGSGAVGLCLHLTSTLPTASWLFTYVIYGPLEKGFWD